MGTDDFSTVDSLFLAKNRIEPWPSFYIVPMGCDPDFLH